MVKACREVIEGVEFLHQNGFSFENLKSTNLLFGEGRVIQLCDFWISEVQTSPGLSPAQTETSPEVLRPYDEDAEVFSFGTVLSELLSSKVSYKPCQRIVEGSLKELVKRCRTHDPAERPSFAQVAVLLKEIGVELEEIDKRKTEIILQKPDLPEPPFSVGEKIVVEPRGEHKATIVWIQWSAEAAKTFVRSLRLESVKWICTSVSLGSSRGSEVEAQAEAYIGELFTDEPADVFKGIGEYGRFSSLALNFAMSCAAGAHPIQFGALLALGDLPMISSERMRALRTTKGVLDRGAVLLGYRTTLPPWDGMSEGCKMYWEDLEDITAEDVTIPNMTVHIVREWLKKKIPNSYPKD